MELHLHLVPAREFIKIDTKGQLDKEASLEMLSNIVPNHPAGEDLLIDLRNVKFMPATMEDIEEVVMYMIDHLRVFRFKIAISNIV